jgi:hypothetical protein
MKRSNRNQQVVYNWVYNMLLKYLPNPMSDIPEILIILKTG